MSRAWIAFYMGDYDKDTQALSTLEHGAYFLLLKHCWIHGSIPAEAEKRANIARLPLKDWKKIASSIDPFFDPEGRNKRATKEIEKADVIRAKRAMAGQRGGLASGISKAIRQGERSKREANANQRYQQITEQIPKLKGQPSEAIHSRIETTSLSVAAREPSELTVSPQLVASLARKAHQ